MVGDFCGVLLSALLNTRPPTRSRTGLERRQQQQTNVATDLAHAQHPRGNPRSCPGGGIRVWGTDRGNVQKCRVGGSVIRGKLHSPDDGPDLSIDLIV